MIALGTISIWIGTATILAATLLYWVAMLRTPRQPAPAAAPGPNGGNGAAAAANGGEPAANGGAAPANGDDPAANGGAAPAAGEDPALLWARRLFYATAAITVVITAAFLALIMGQHYEVRYVWQNSDAALPPHLRFATWWAGQEGTFILWGLMTSVFGVLVLWKARAEERWVMPFYCIALGFLFSMMLVMGPFLPHPLNNEDLLAAMRRQDIAIPAAGLQTLAYYTGFWQFYPIPDGQGLNDLLQNPWMVIHPPTLFLGYSSMLVPACFALGALVRRDYDNWLHRAAPWLMFAWLILGAGIFLGGYWAYETLGWGGYWAWDPVENSSLLPWLIGTALIHGMLAQRVRGNFKQVNLLLGVLLYSGVLYGSFLTRSGVLEGVSVHAFATPEESVFFALVIFQVIWLGIGLPLWFSRFKEIDSEAAYQSVWERSFGFFLALIIILSITGIVVLFVSWPMMSVLFGERSSVPQQAYDRAIIPVAMLMLLLMAITPHAPWRHVREGAPRMKPEAKFTIAAAVLLLIAFLPAGYVAWLGGWVDRNGALLTVFALAALLCMGSNFAMLIRTLRGGFWNIGAWVCHIGFALLMIGVVVSTFYGKDDPSPQGLVLQQGGSAVRFNYQITYRGYEQFDDSEQKRGYEQDFIVLDVTRVRTVEQPGYHPEVNPEAVEVVPVGPTRTLRAPYYFSERMDDYVKWPAMVREWWGDLQIATAVHDDGRVEIGELRQGETSDAEVVQYYARDPRREVALRVDRFTAESLDSLVPLLPPDQQEELGPIAMQSLLFVAELTAIIDDEEHPLEPALTIFTPGRTPGPFHQFRRPELPGFDSLPYLVKMTPVPDPGNPGFHLAEFEITPLEPKDLVSLAVLFRPGVNIVWFGCYLLLLGAFICYRRRARLAAQTNPKRSPTRKKAGRLPAARKEAEAVVAE